MLRVKKSPVAKADVLEVIHNQIPDTAAGAGAAPIPQRTYKEGGMTWRRMLRAVAVTEVVGLAALLVAGTVYGLDFFAPLAVAALLFAGATAWIPRMSKASTIYSLVVCSLTLLMFGGAFFGWTGFLYWQSWFEMTFATLTVLVPIAGIVAAIAVLRRREGAEAARRTGSVVGALAAAIVLVGVVGSVVANDATRLPGDTSLTAMNFEFEQTALTAKAGDVAIYFDNQDPFAHNVKIEGVGATEDAAGRQAIRHVFKNLAAGTYTFICSIHPDMKGTLTVT